VLDRDHDERRSIQALSRVARDFTVWDFSTRGTVIV